MHRRSYLAGLGVGAATLAGCAGAPTNSDDLTDDQSAKDVFQLGPDFSEPRWADSAMPTDAAGYVARFGSRDELRWLVDTGSTPDDVVAFVEATDFESAAILYLQSAGPNGCYRKLAVEDVTVDDAITATASAVDESEEGTICTQAVTYPAAFVRVTGDDLPSSTRVTLTNGWGTTAEVNADAPLVDPDTLAGGVTPDGDPTAVPAPLICERDGFERHPKYVDDDNVAYGTLTDDSGQPTLALRGRNPGGDAIDDLTFERGERIEFRLHNVSSQYVITGNKHKYNLQLRTEAGWGRFAGRPRNQTGCCIPMRGSANPLARGSGGRSNLPKTGCLRAIHTRMTSGSVPTSSRVATGLPTGAFPTAISACSSITPTNDRGGDRTTDHVSGGSSATISA
jgi:hypothetical protein